MKRATIGVSIVLGFLLGPTFIHAEPVAPATPPARLPIPKDETPADALLRGVKVYELLDVDAAMELFDYSGESDAKFCRLECEYAVAITRVELAIRQKWGREADDAFVHALGEQTDDDVRQAHVTVDGNHAVVQYKGDGAPAIPMVRINGVWKLAVHEMIAAMSPAEAKDLAAGLTAVRDGLPKIGDDLKMGKLNSSDAAVAAARKLSEEAFKTTDDAKK